MDNLDMDSIHAKACCCPPCTDQKVRELHVEIELARRAREVMERRGWWPYKAEDGRWYAGGRYAMSMLFGTDGAKGWEDPFVALVEADKWYRENVEGKR